MIEVLTMKSDRSKKDDIILQQLEVIRTMSENNLKRMNSDFWGSPLLTPETPAGKTPETPAAPDGLCVSESDCPNQDCVRSGVISKSGQSIVCLPARIVIELQGGSGGVDVILG